MNSDQGKSERSIASEGRGAPKGPRSSRISPVSAKGAKACCMHRKKHCYLQQCLKEAVISFIAGACLSKDRFIGAESINEKQAVRLRIDSRGLSILQGHSVVSHKRVRYRTETQMLPTASDGGAGRLTGICMLAALPEPKPVFSFSFSDNMRR